MNPILTDSNACLAAREIVATAMTALTNARGQGKACVIAWQYDEKATCWHGESGGGCGCGCGPSEPVRYS